MRELARRTTTEPKAGKTPQPSYDPYSTYGVDDSDGWIGPLPVKVVSVIRRGMRVLELGCGDGALSLWIAQLVGPAGLVVGIDESAEAIDVAQKRATVSGQCYWTRFVNADHNTFVPHERYDIIVLHRARERATFLQLSSCLEPDGVILIVAGTLTGSNRSSETALLGHEQLGRHIP